MFSNKIIKFIHNLYPLKRGKKRFLKPFYRGVKGYEIVRDTNNNLMLLNLDNYIDSIIYLEGNFEQEDIEFLYNLFLEYECNYFLDIGANIGIYSIYFSKNTNLKMCYAFEPDPNNYTQLTANVLLNKKNKKIKLFNCALSDISSKGELFITNEKKDFDLGKCNTGTHSLEKDNNRHGDKIEVDVHRGDDLIDIQNECICLKIDVEGHELSVLKGLIKLFSSNKCIIMIEIFDENYHLTNKFLAANKFKSMHSDVNIGVNYFYKNF